VRAHGRLRLGRRRALGATIIGMAFIGIQFSGWNTDWRFLFLGVVLLVAVLVNNYIRKRAEGARR